MGTGNGIYVTSDNGKTWNHNTGLAWLTQVSSFAISGNNIFAGVYTGIYKTELIKVVLPVITNLPDAIIAKNSSGNIDFSISGYNLDSLIINFEIIKSLSFTIR